MGESIFTSNISNNGYGVQNYSVAYLKPYNLSGFPKRESCMFQFRKSYLAFKFYRNLRITRHLVLITHHAVVIMKESIVNKYARTKNRQN